ncbi:MAG: hypothetical protein A3G73_03820 [Rhodospirillales bacterium RIFCSPLOWO2_12_FULL_67_15]|nr:MAG: hypothetical protein A3G73_03820 [Rhodospirillales bacterium RIFCSPLOWO2_12_FULL_67_15]
MVSIFGTKDKKPPPSAPVPLNWARNKNGKFNKFVTLDVARAGIAGGGIFVLWHSGAKPRWVMVGASADLAKDIRKLLDDEELLEYNVHGGLFVSWAPVRPEYHAGVIKYLRESMKPLIDRGPPSPEDVDPIPVTAPGGAGRPNE